MKKISGSQVKAARALLNWSQEDLANKSSLTMTPVSRMEREGIEFRNREGLVCVKVKLPK